jgi:hypothetical protein
MKPGYYISDVWKKVNKNKLHTTVIDLIPVLTSYLSKIQREKLKAIFKSQSMQPILKRGRKKFFMNLWY